VEHELVNLLPRSWSKEELNQIWKGAVLAVDDIVMRQ
jgi:hypothetical protein